MWGETLYVASLLLFRDCIQVPQTCWSIYIYIETYICNENLGKAHSGNHERFDLSGVLHFCLHSLFIVHHFLHFSSYSNKS